jgi:hypothetical protein
MVTSIEPPSLNGLYCLQFFDALISSLPSVYSTRACSAARTSSPLPLSLGRTSTTVSVRSVAVIRASPTPISITTVMGPGVSNVGIAVPPKGSSRASVLWDAG